MLGSDPSLQSISVFVLVSGRRRFRCRHCCCCGSEVIVICVVGMGVQMRGAPNAIMELPCVVVLNYFVRFVRVFFLGRNPPKASPLLSASLILFGHAPCTNWGRGVSPDRSRRYRPIMPQWRGGTRGNQQHHGGATAAPGAAGPTQPHQGRTQPCCT